MPPGSIAALSLVLALLVPATAPDAHAQDKPSPSKENDRPRVLLVKPVILRDDDGSNPALHALPRQLVNRAYTRAGLEFLYLEPVFWNHSSARRGEISLNEIVTQGRANGTISADRRIVTMLFVSAVDGNTRPLGRGMQNGNVCFVSLGNGESMKDPAMRSFVVAHEVGHCLGLVHAVDDPLVPDDSPNLQGDGPFDQRLAESGLHPSQVATIGKSPLAIERVKFHTAAESAALLTNDPWNPGFETSSDANLRFVWGLPAGTDIPKELPKKREFIRERNSAITADFTTEESAGLHRLIQRIDEISAGDWPLLTRLPWHFIKTKPGFCMNFPHTRGLATVLSEPALQRILTDEPAGIRILFHEKIHILQRLNPGRFQSIYQEYGFTPVRLQREQTNQLGLIQNPDAPDWDWAVSLPSGPLLVSMACRNTPSGPDYRETLFPLQLQPDGSHRIGPEWERQDVLEPWKNRFRIHSGYDHPNEVFAYLSDTIPQHRILHEPPDAATPAANRTNQSIPSLFGLTGNPDD